MPIDVKRLAAMLEPATTVLLFGAGSSIPSGAPSVSKLMQRFESALKIPFGNFTLSEYSGVLEKKLGRKAVIAELRKAFKGVAPTGGILNMPLYEWRSIYTTNYDTLIEQCYARQGKELLVYSSNFDFTVHNRPNATSLFKLHGDLGKDTSDGQTARIILTDGDYDNTLDYREALYDRLRADLNGGHLVIIGHSLSDPHIAEVARRAATLNANSLGALGQISFLMYEKDEDRASLYEARGFSVCFAGVDEFFAALVASAPEALPDDGGDDEQSLPASLNPTTLDIDHASRGEANVNSMFNGWPATHADIASNLTFERSIGLDIADALAQPGALVATLLGASGVGKTTAARQVAHHLMKKGYHCWEHKAENAIQVIHWRDFAGRLKEAGQLGFLVIDDAHAHLQELNELLDYLVLDGVDALKLLCVSTRNQWNPRIKAAAFFKRGGEHKLSKLNPAEIDRLLNLVETNTQIRPLIEQTFNGFSRHERRRRLIERCEADMFVCMKNIFASEKFDDIILREYAALSVELQDIYRVVAAMETAGIRVHRQLVIRLLNIPAQQVASALTHLTDIIHEYVVDRREGIYGWRGRHAVIVGIISKYKFNDTDRIIRLFSDVIACISPTYDIEIRTIRELCNVETGLPRIADKAVQNTLLRKMISVAPGERVPRHRLIRNLIALGDFEQADTEIRIFDKDFGRDGPVARYKVSLLAARAEHTPGIMDEDRLAILDQARELAVTSIRRFPQNKNLLASYCDVGLAIFKKTGDLETFDDAMEQLKAAESRLGDPEISRLVMRYERSLSGEIIDAEVDIEAAIELLTAD